MSPTNYTLAELDEMLAVEAKATPGELRGHGVYLSPRKDIGFNVEHISELGQKQSGLPYQAVPFARPEDTALLALARNHFRRLIEEVKRLKEDEARLDWLERECVFQKNVPQFWRNRNGNISFAPYDEARLVEADNIRAAIDAAREKP